MTFNKTAFGNRISKARNAIDITQEEMADRCSISVSHIRHLEGGNRTPSLCLLVEICNVLQVSPDYLLQDSIGKTQYDRLEGQMKNLNVKYLKLANDVVAVIAKYSDLD